MAREIKVGDIVVFGRTLREIRYTVVSIDEDVIAICCIYSKPTSAETQIWKVDRNAIKHESHRQRQRREEIDFLCQQGA